MTKLTREEAIQDLQGIYCCYCCERKTYGSCCGENHFVEFADLYDEDKESMIEDYLKEE